MQESIRFRPASADDLTLLLKWRNNEDTRRFSLNKEVVTEQQHSKWLLQTLTDPKCKLLVAEYNNQPIGTSRVDFTEDGCLISWTLAPEFRGRGFGKRLVKLLVNQLKGKISAKILPDNIASLKAAEFAGMKYERKIDGVLHYEYRNPY